MALALLRLLQLRGLSTEKLLESKAFFENFRHVVSLRHAGVKGERSYKSYSFLTSALDGVSGQRHAPTGLTPGTHRTGGLLGLRAGLNTQDIQPNENEIRHEVQTSYIYK
jgi:hypothetical protein